jgi:hypothetical protein
VLRHLPAEAGMHARVVVPALTDGHALVSS